VLSPKDKIIKRLFDIVLSFFGLIFTSPIIFISWIIASIDTKSNGLFVQKRVGRDAKLFDVYKIKTMRKVDNINTTVTTQNDVRITKSGAFFRNTKIDELPQLFNVFIGNMSFVGARPDVEGFADKLVGDDRVILSLPPAITGPASIKYKNEETILANVDNPQEYNRDVIWVDKVKINREYIENWSLLKDIKYIIKTVI